jgi:O-6-methylguanine DNA methyltransferase
VAFGPHGICHVALAEELDGDDSRFAALHERRFGRSAVPAASALPGLAEALRSGRGDRLRYDLRGVSGFQAVVLAATLRIPPGEVRTYGELAAELGKPRAARAVGQALARNPVPVLVPCHRVVAADGGLGGYGLGLEAKRRLLAAEGHTKPSRIE